MATGLSSPLGVMGIIFIIIGIIMVVIGIILLVASQTREKSWYVWILLIVGVIIGIVGGIILAIALSQQSTIEPVYHTIELGSDNETVDSYPQTMLTEQRSGTIGTRDLTSPSKQVYVSRTVPVREVR